MSTVVDLQQKIPQLTLLGRGTSRAAYLLEDGLVLKTVRLDLETKHPSKIKRGRTQNIFEASLFPMSSYFPDVVEVDALGDWIKITYHPPATREEELLFFPKMREAELSVLECVRHRFETRPRSRDRIGRKLPNYWLDPDSVMVDFCDEMTRLGIEPRDVNNKNFSLKNGFVVFDGGLFSLRGNKD